MQTPMNTAQAHSITPAPIIFTQSAARKVWELIQEEGNPALKLRVFITGGGCSGFQYGFSFDEQINEDDVIIYGIVGLGREDEEDGGTTDAGDEGEAGSGGAQLSAKRLKAINEVDAHKNPEEKKEEDDSASGGGNQVMLLVDSMSLQYLIGATIDYSEDISGGQFRISNPNAKTTCGCGSSFSAG